MTNIAVLQQTIRIHFKNQDLLKNIFIHRSFLNENKNSPLISNEKLEFLGDSVLSLVTSVYLYHTYPALEEGDYTEIKASIVRTESLALAAKAINLGDHLYLSKGQDKEGGRTNTNILADCFEALIGGIFIDQGFEVAYQFVVNHLFKDHLSYIIDNKLYLSPKSRLQEYTQAQFKTTPRYRVIEQKGPEHKRTFKIAVSINNKIMATAQGKSKKQAEENAAKIALEKMM